MLRGLSPTVRPVNGFQVSAAGQHLGAAAVLFGMNEWSFSQLCKLADVSKDTLNKLSPDTASGHPQPTYWTWQAPCCIMRHDLSVK